MNAVPLITREPRMPSIPIGRAPRRAPGPTGPVPTVRNVLRLQRDAGALFTDMHARYGSTVRLPLGPYLTHLNLHPDGIRHVLQENNSNYVRGAMYERFKIFFGLGLLTTDGEEWRTRRRRVNPLFHRSAIDGMADTMTDATDTVLDRLHASAMVGRPVDVLPPMMDLALAALGRIIFGTDLLPHSERVAPAMAVSLDAMIFKGNLAQMTPDWVPTPYHRRIRRAQAVIDAAVDRIIVEHENRSADPDRPTLVDLLLAAREPADGSVGITATAVRDEMKTIFMAGHETTGTGLAWALQELAGNPQAQERLAAEVDAALSGRRPGLDDLAQLPFAKMVADETLRLHPPIWLYPRDAVADDEIQGYSVPAGSSVFMVPLVTHRDPQFWPRPGVFDPERFDQQHAKDRPRFAYFPFGGGQRQCIGNSMALLQMQLTIAMVAQRYRLRRAAGFTPKMGTLVSLRPLNGMSVVLERRRG
jgi:cytochrome P450